MPSPTEITAVQLARLIGTPDAPVVIDVRVDEDFVADPRIVPTALRHRFDETEQLAARLPGARIVVICQGGLKLSQGAAATLRAHRVTAEHLQGGFLAWRDAGLPLIPADKIPARRHDGRTLWVTRQRPKIDRLACPWLIRRFIDRDATFLFVTPAEVPEVAHRFNATPFDVADVFWSHHAERCTFDVMLEEFALQTDPLCRLGAIVRGADTDRLDLTPQSAGLLAVSLGLSRMYRDDLAQLDAGMVLYDAFYRWARDAVDEGHDWPTTPIKPAS